MRHLLYQILIHTLLPVIYFASRNKCRKAIAEQPKLKFCLQQKFGKLTLPYDPVCNTKTTSDDLPQNGILIHAVSLGETRSVLPLISELQARYPHLPLTLSNGSVRGAKQIVDFLPKGVHHTFLPLDYPFAVERFLTQMSPKLVLVIETEIWPNFFSACHKKSIPLILANARLKQSSLHTYQKWGGDMIKNTLNHCHKIACQFPIDQTHFQQLGVPPQKLATFGNLKFDIDPQAILQKGGGVKTVETWHSKVLQSQSDNPRFCWVAASTHEKEETLMLEAHRQLRTQIPNAILILVPRQADRFEEVADLCQDWQTARRSVNETIDSDTQVYLADSVGEMMTWFAIADVAFIGGSLVPFGGHNILEPAALGKPVISGKWHQNLQALYDQFKAENAITIVGNTQALSQHLITLAQSPEQCHREGDIALQAFQKNTGALEKLLAEIDPLLS